MIHRPACHCEARAGRLHGLEKYEGWDEDGEKIREELRRIVPEYNAQSAEGMAHGGKPKEQNQSAED